MCPISAYRVGKFGLVLESFEDRKQNRRVSQYPICCVCKLCPLKSSLNLFVLTVSCTFWGFPFLTAISSPHQILSPSLQLATEIPNISQRQLCWTRWKLNTCATCKDFTYAGCKSGVSGYFSFIGELIWLEDTEISHVQDCFISLLPVATDSIFSEPGWLADQQGSPAAQFRKRMSHTSMAASACEATRAQIKSKARWTHFVLLSFDHSSFWHLSTNQVRTSVGCIVVNLETKWDNKYNFYQISCFEPQGIIRLSQGNPIANSASTLWATFLNSWGLLQKLQNLFRDALVCFAGGAPN